MQRVMVIGCGGAGKSWLSRQLAERTDLPLIHLDREYWQPGWVMPDKPRWRKRLRDLMASERWIIDGNYGSTLSERLAVADTVIFLDLPTLTCLYGIFERRVRNRGSTRPDMTPGCPERINWEFFTYVLLFRARDRQKIISALDGVGGRVVRLTSRRDMERFLGDLKGECEALPVSP